MTAESYLSIFSESERRAITTAAESLGADADRLAEYVFRSASDPTADVMIYHLQDITKGGC